MWDDGYENIISIDYSDMVISKMDEKIKIFDENFKC